MASSCAERSTVSRRTQAKIRAQTDTHGTPTAAEPSAPPADEETRRGGLRSVLADSAIYGLGVGMLPAALLVATPLIARRVNPDGFGAIDLLTSVLTLASAAAILGLDTGLARSYFDYTPDQLEERLVVVRTAFVTVLGVSAALAATLALATLLFAEVLHQQPSTVSISTIAAAFVLLPLSNSVVMAREIYRLERERTRYVVTTGVQAVIGVGAAFVLVEAGAGPAGYFAGLAAGALAALVVCLASWRPLTSDPLVDRRQLRTMLGYGLPLVPAALATWVIFAVDRTLLASFRGLFDVGYYALASKVAAPLFMALNAFTVAWVPFIFNQTPERQLELRARAVTAVAAAAGCGYVLVLFWAPQLIGVLGGASYDRSLKAVPGIALGWLGWGVAYVIATEFVISRRTRVIGAATVIAAATNVLLNIALIPPFGFVGAAWATAATFALLAVMYFVIERRSARAPYRWGRLLAIMLVIAGASFFLLRTSGRLAGRAPAAAAAIAGLVAIAAGDRGTGRTSWPIRHR